MALVRACGFVIYRHSRTDIEYLIMQASYADHHWTPPKGHVEAGEDDLETAFRETEEEAGIKRTQLEVDLNFKKILNYQVKGKPKEVVYWPAKLIDSKAQVRLSKEHQKYRWAALREAIDYLKFSDMTKMLEEIDNHLKTVIM